MWKVSHNMMILRLKGYSHILYQLDIVEVMLDWVSRYSSMSMNLSQDLIWTLWVLIMLSTKWIVIWDGRLTLVEVGFLGEISWNGSPHFSRGSVC